MRLIVGDILMATKNDNNVKLNELIPISLEMDSLSAISRIKNSSLAETQKTIDIKFHWIKDSIAQGHATVSLIAGHKTCQQIF